MLQARVFKFPVIPGNIEVSVVDSSSIVWGAGTNVSILQYLVFERGFYLRAVISWSSALQVSLGKFLSGNYECRKSDCPWAECLGFQALRTVTLLA